MAYYGDISRVCHTVNLLYCYYTALLCFLATTKDWSGGSGKGEDELLYHDDMLLHHHLGLMSKS